MLFPVLWMFAQTDGGGGIPIPFLVPGLALLTIAIGVVVQSFRVFNRSVGSVTDRLTVVEAENASIRADNVLLRHQQGWGERRLAWLARRAAIAHVPIPAAFWADAGPPGRPYPDLDQEEP